MKDQKKTAPTKNDNYTDAFPVNDNNKKREDTGVRDKSRPFDNSRRDTKTKDYNPTGTTLNDKHPFKDK